MKKILINFLTSNTGGVINFKRDLIYAIDNNYHKFEYEIFCLVSHDSKEHIGSLKNIRYVTNLNAPESFIKKIFFYESGLNKVIKSNNINVLINFGDIPAKTNIDQIFYFDWPYAVYDDYEVWRRMTIKDFASKFLKRIYFKITSNRPKKYIVQTQTMYERLSKKIKNSLIQIIDVGFNQSEYLNSQSSKSEWHLTENITLIYPTAMYPHKNVEILIDVAKLLKELNILINFKLTFSYNSGKKEIDFINKVHANNLNDYFSFLGRLRRVDLVKEIKSSSAIIMPTLIETYGLPYLEAQIFNKVMFTSDRDFAKELCGNSAIFFDPLDANDIAQKIINNIFSEHIMNNHLNQIENEMRKRISWDESSIQIMNLIQDQ